MPNNNFTTKIIDIIVPSKVYNHLFIVMDFYESDLRKVLKSRKQIKFTE